MPAMCFESIIKVATSRIEFWQRFLEQKRVESIAEIGVWKGDFAKAVLEHCPTIKRYYMIDPWATLPDWNKPFNVGAKEFDDVYTEAMGKVGFASERVVVLRGRTKEVISKIPDESLDFAYIDGDHTLRGITIDMIKVFQKVKENGYLAGDDFSLSPWQHDVRFEPTLVFPFAVFFAEAMNVPIFALPFNQFIIKKETNSSFSLIDYVGKYNDLSLNKLALPSTGLRK